MRVLGPGPRHWELLRETIEDGQVRGGLLTDAVIVALCRERGVATVLSAGPGFRRFSSVTWEHLG